MSEPVTLVKAGKSYKKTKKKGGGRIAGFFSCTDDRHNLKKTQKTKQKERGSHYPPCWVEAKLINKAAGEGVCHKTLLLKHDPFFLFCQYFCTF